MPVFDLSNMMRYNESLKRTKETYNECIKTVDKETGCRLGYNNQTESCDYAAYEQCRQAYYLKKQTQILESQQTSHRKEEQIIQQKEQKIEGLESQNQEIQGVLDGQNKQIEGLTKELGQQNQKLTTLTASLQDNTSMVNQQKEALLKSNLLNIGFAVILAAVLIYLALNLIKKKKAL